MCVSVDAKLMITVMTIIIMGVIHVKCDRPPCSMSHSSYYQSREDDDDDSGAGDE